MLKIKNESEAFEKFLRKKHEMLFKPRVVLK